MSGQETDVAWVITAELGFKRREKNKKRKGQEKRLKITGPNVVGGASGGKLGYCEVEMLKP